MTNSVKLFRVEAGDYLTSESIFARLSALPAEEKQRIEREILLASRSLSDSLERTVSPSPHAPLPPPTPEGEIASESVLRGSRGIVSTKENSNG